MIIRVLTAPVQVLEDRIVFNSVKLTLPVDINGSKKYDSNPIYDGAMIYSAEPSDPLIVYLDTSKEPKYSRHDEGMGWISPTQEKIIEAREAGIELEFIDNVICKCQKGELSAEDFVSLERCGHAAACPRAIKEPQKIVSNDIRKIIDDPAAIQGHQAIMNAYDQALKQKIEEPKPEFIPPGGINSDQLGGLMASLRGTDSSVEMGLDETGLSKEGVDFSVVARQMAKFYTFTQCNTCGLWNEVVSIHNPRCSGCTVASS